MTFVPRWNPEREADVQTLDGVVCSEMLKLVSVSKEHLELVLQYFADYVRFNSSG